ncbi:hypothetical protein [Stenotrophomonas maltophilia]|uniref:hypothetical protein n=1 Tax=Stenotrophomonas maltophilia TaxID=40324 RepID=UPI000F6850F5|nr:hypothetical protein [Stenotrophomonas maltophilia]RRU74154.1 hypothetical protein EGJ89_07495 [Stenotrophomonas maltophilia]
MARKTTQADFVKTALRIPPDLHARVHQAAEADGRTYNAQLVHIIGEFFTRLDEDQDARAMGAVEERAVGVGYGMDDPRDRAAVLKVLLFQELSVLRQRVNDLGGRDAVLQRDKAEIAKAVTGPKITGTDGERRSHMSRALETYPLTTLFTDEELDKLAERVITAQRAIGHLK